MSREGLPGKTVRSSSILSSVELPPIEPISTDCSMAASFALISLVDGPGPVGMGEGGSSFGVPGASLVPTAW